MTMERLNDYAQYGLGLGAHELRLAPHHPRWKRVFSDEAHLIYDRLRLEDLRLHHCGSTSVPEILAKPIIDIVGSVASLAELDLRRRTLEDIGYEWKGEHGIPGRRYAVLGRAEGGALAHLHLFERGRKEFEDHLLFRDYLRADATAAREYEAEKTRLATLPSSREAYTNAKSTWITEAMKRAATWRRPPRSVLAILGSAPGGGNTRAFLEERYPGPGLEIVDLNETRVGPYSYGAPGEALDDGFARVVERMIESDLTVIATPVYWYAMSGPMKDFLDRFSNLLRGRHKALGERLYGKKIALLSTGSDARLPMGFEVPFASTAIYLAMDYLGARYRSY